MAAAKSKKAKKTVTKKKLTKKSITKKSITKKTAAKKPAAKKTAKKVTKATTKTKSVKKAASKHELVLKNTPVSSKQTQAQIISDLADATSLEKIAVKNVLEALRNQIHRHLKVKGSGEMTLPSLGIKVRRISKKATKARKGVNPFTGEPMTIAAKPARKAARATALKALKDLV